MVTFVSIVVLYQSVKTNLSPNLKYEFKQILKLGDEILIPYLENEGSYISIGFRVF